MFTQETRRFDISCKFSSGQLFTFPYLCSFFECPHCTPTVVFKLLSVESKAIELRELDRTQWIVLISRAFDCIRSLKCFCESLIVFDYRTQSNPIAWIRPRLISRSFSLVRVFETVILVISVKTEVEHLLPLELSLSALALSVLLGKS